MKIAEILFGTGKNLTALQMCDRDILIFIIALVLIRISGRRSFGMHNPLDSIITILPGAILSRAVTGSSPFLPVVAACSEIVLIHRLLSWLIAHSPRLCNFIEGKVILLFNDGKFLKDNMRKALLSKEDIMEGTRIDGLSDDLNKIEKVYMERNGKISIIKKAIKMFADYTK